MKKLYQIPNVELFLLGASDIVTTSVILTTFDPDLEEGGDFKEIFS